jgi:hypothetical protein
MVPAELLQKAMQDYDYTAVTLLNRIWRGRRRSQMDETILRIARRMVSRENVESISAEPVEGDKD